MLIDVTGKKKSKRELIIQISTKTPRFIQSLQHIFKTPVTISVDLFTLKCLHHREDLILQNLPNGRNKLLNAFMFRNSA